MWRLFNNPNQEPITLSIFGVVLNTQSAKSSSFACWFYGVSRRPADLLPKAEATGGEWSNESKIENHISIFHFQFVSYWLKFKWTKITRKVKVPLQFSCSMIKFSFICDYYNLYVILQPKFDRTKLALLWNKHSLSIVSSVSFTISETEIETSNPQILRWKVVLSSDGSVEDSRAGIFRGTDSKLWWRGELEKFSLSQNVKLHLKLSGK